MDRHESIEGFVAHAQFQSESAEATFDIGANLSVLLKPGDWVGLSGVLGAGKTALVRGIAVGMGLDVNDFASPTFTLVHRYPGLISLCHADVYRLTDASELTDIGLLDGGDDEVRVVEWFEKFQMLILAANWRVSIAGVGTQKRVITVEKRAE